MRCLRVSGFTVLSAFCVGASVSLARAEPPVDAPSAPAVRAHGVGRADPVADPGIASVRAELETALARARAKGLPEEWLVDKVAEGLAKRVPPPRIVPAVNALLSRIETADRVLAAIGTKGAGKPPERDSLLRATVDALAVGAPEQALVGLGRAVAAGGGKPSDVRAGFVGVAELGERGFGGPASVEAVQRAFERGGPDAWPWLLSQAEGIGDVGAEARVEALRHAAERVQAAPIPDGLPFVGDRLGSVGETALPVAPPSDVSFGLGTAREAATKRGPPR